jgi:uncharacterized protein YukE
MDDAAGPGGGSSTPSGAWPGEVEDLRNGVRTMLSDVGMASNEIEGMVLDFATPFDIDASKQMTEWLNSASGVVAENLESGLGKVSSKMDANWEGDAADGFSDFVSAMMDSVRKQKDILAELHATMDAFHQIVAGVRTDLTDLVEMYQKAFEEGGDDATIAKGLTIAATLAGIAAAEGPAAPLGVITACLGGMSAASTISGDDAISTAESLGDALKKLREKTDERAEQIVEALKGIREKMKEDDVKEVLKPGKPDIIGGVKFDSDEFAPKGMDSFTSINDGVSTDPLLDEKSA